MDPKVTKNRKTNVYLIQYGKSFSSEYSRNSWSLQVAYIFIQYLVIYSIITSFFMVIAILTSYQLIYYRSTEA